VVSTDHAAAAPSAIERARCVVFGYHEVGYTCIESLLALRAPIAALFTHQDNPGEEIWWRSCADLAQRNSIPVYTPEAIDEAWVARVAELTPSVIYSFSYRSLLPERLLRLAPLGAYNVHPAMLPKYRGRVPINWMLVNGEREGGVTLHHMVARADAGDIVAQRAVAIDDDDTAFTLYGKIVPIGAALVREFHPLIAEGRAPRHPQNLAAGSYWGRRRAEDGRISWNWPARRIYNLVRAVTHPYPGAFCFIGDRKMMVWGARIAVESGARGEPGTIIGPRDSGIEVAAGEGSVVLTRVQIGDDAETAATEISAGGGGTTRLE